MLLFRLHQDFQDQGDDVNARYNNVAGRCLLLLAPWLSMRQVPRHNQGKCRQCRVDQDCAIDCCQDFAIRRQKRGAIIVFWKRACSWLLNFFLLSYRVFRCAHDSLFNVCLDHVQRRTAFHMRSTHILCPFRFPKNDSISSSCYRSSSIHVQPCGFSRALTI